MTSTSYLLATARLLGAQDSSWSDDTASRTLLITESELGGALRGGVKMLKQVNGAAAQPDDASAVTNRQTNTARSPRLDNFLDGVKIIGGVLAASGFALGPIAAKALHHSAERGFLLETGRDSALVFRDPNISIEKSTFDRRGSVSVTPQYELSLKGLEPGSYTIEGLRSASAASEFKAAMPPIEIFKLGFDVAAGKDRGSFEHVSTVNFNEVRITQHTGTMGMRSDVIFFSLNGGGIPSTEP